MDEEEEGWKTTRRERRRRARRRRHQRSGASEIRRQLWLLGQSLGFWAWEWWWQEARAWQRWARWRLAVEEKWQREAESWRKWEETDRFLRDLWQKTGGAVEADWVFVVEEVVDAEAVEAEAGAVEACPTGTPLQFHRI